MSRRRVYADGQYTWQDQGESGYRPERPSMGGSLVVSGRATGPVMGFWGKGMHKTAAEVAEARQRFHPHGKAVR